ncbi:hypothetical protein B0A48_15811 [Cryoendolithus antarcticus]|uniref:Malate dehydrogenase n=1 Tax=Cryoendolithus antarcticus TaxID=1507870 RepID=A0A1V8SHJ0_9PEZI|nr:hypothetical protein B0A48_15811 [Cryoendolithus antarcticus]
MAPLTSLVATLALLSSTAFALPPLQRSAAPVLPVNEVGPGFPPPPPGASPVFIALGVGTQNYTCNATSLTFGSNVALADLYDVTRFINANTKNSITNLYLAASTTPIKNPLQLQHIGKHYFTKTVSGNSPNFDFTESGKGFLQAKKVASVTAPADAWAGLKGQAYGAVDWLYLVDNGAGVSRQLGSVYRVETAGGKPPASCKAGEQAFVPYAAEYWFYR